MTNGWPNPERPGVPANPERDGWHWIVSIHDDRAIQSVYWSVNRRAYDFPHAWTAYETASSGWRYLGPCLLPAEVAALVEAARREGFDAGFDASGEGWNGEYPGDVRARANWPEWREEHIAEFARRRARGAA